METVNPVEKWPETLRYIVTDIRGNMYIYATAGYEVRYSSNGGEDNERADIESLGIKVGDVLTVSYTKVRKFYTDVAFDEIAGLHNSALFGEI